MPLYWLLLGLFAHQNHPCLAAAPTKVYRAPLYGANHPDRSLGHYLVEFRHDGEYSADQHWRAIGVNLSSSERFHHLSLISGYIATMNDSTLDAVRRDRSVARVKADRKIRITFDRGFDPPNGSDTMPSFWSPVGHQKRDSGSHFLKKTQPDRVPWNLAVVGTPHKLETPVLSNTHEYQYFAPSVRGVKVYVIDSGIFLENPLFDGRAINLDGAAPDSRCLYAAYDPDTECPPTWEDEEGHGTGVAGIVGADRVGLARDAQIVSAKFIDTDLEDHVDFYDLYALFSDLNLKHHEDLKLLSDSDYRGAVWVMAWNQADVKEAQAFKKELGWIFKDSIEAGITIVASAGNRKEDAALNFPCNVEGVICVGSVGEDYDVSEDSNYGAPVAFLAPGKFILSTARRSRFSSITGRPPTKIRSGTSFAAPHVAGVAAIYRSWLGRNGADGPELVQLMRKNALQNVCEDVHKGDANLLINTGFLYPASVKGQGEPFKGAGKQPVGADWRNRPADPAGGTVGFEADDADEKVPRSLREL